MCPRLCMCDGTPLCPPPLQTVDAEPWTALSSHESPECSVALREQISMVHSSHLPRKGGEKQKLQGATEMNKMFLLVCEGFIDKRLADSADCLFYCLHLCCWTLTFCTACPINRLSVKECGQDQCVVFGISVNAVWASVADVLVCLFSSFRWL